MARLIERKFDPAEPVFARKYFTANGHKYKPGDELDWRRLSIAQRRVMQMFEAGMLRHEENTPKRIEPEFTPQRIEPEPISDEYDLDAIDDMKELRRIADEIGAPYKVSKVDQREAIRDMRAKI